MNYSVKDYQMEYNLNDAFPNMPESYENKIKDTFKRLPSKPRRNLKKASIAVAASFTLILAALIYFVANPALAANIPVINEMVYQLSAAVEPSKQTKEEVVDTVSSVLNDLYASEDFNKFLRINNDTLIMANYLQYQALKAAELNDGEALTATQINIESIEQKGFRISAKINFTMLLDGKNAGTETIDVLLENTSTGMLITAFSGNNDAFRSYANDAVQYAKERGTALDENAMMGYSMFLYGKLIIERYIQESDRTCTPEEKRMGNVAVELRYQFYLAKKTHMIPDLSKLIERNENTDLFFYTMDLYIQAAQTYGTQLYCVERGSFEILDKPTEKDGSVKLHIYVYTNIGGGVGEELILTLKKTDNGYIIIGYDEGFSDGYYQQMKIIVEDLMKKDKSLSRSEANALAYQKMKDIQESDRKWLQEHPEISID
ncbi:MAG: hypothetical protein ACOYU3_06280 [Bacillota bacterium]